MLPPRVDTPYDSVMELKSICDNRMVLVFDIARQTECLLTNFSWEGGRKSFCSLSVMETDPLTILAFNESSVVFDVPCRNVQPNFVVELGACTGAMSVGPNFLGATTLASLDFNSLACEHLANNSHGVVHHANLLDPKATRDLHACIGPVPHVTMYGFPCQPYSSQGLKLHQADPRSKAFWAGLRLVFLMQAQACLSGCVTGLDRCQCLARFEKSLAQIMRWRIHEVTLKLEDQWPMHRCRWWCLLCPEDWPSVDLCPWPVSLEFSRILDVLPRWGVWPCHQEDELLLTQQQFQYYSGPKYGTDCRFLSGGSKASTVLHSYGNALGPCPCQCRATRFTEDSLILKGLRGFFINSERYNQPRFLHACELAVLLTLPLSMKFDLGQRASLCLLGLVAAPLQALWFWAHLLLLASRAGLMEWNESPTVTIRRSQLELLRQIDVCFPFAANDIPASIAISSGDLPLYLLRAGFFSMGQLSAVECMALDWGERVSFRDSFGSRLRPNFKIFPGIDSCLEMIVASKKQSVDQPLGLLMIRVEHEGKCYVSYVPAGAFLFIVCYEHGLPSNLCFADASETFFGPDTRLWKSHMFTSVKALYPPTSTDPDPSAVPVKRSRVALGPFLDNTMVGLDDQAIWISLLAIKEQLRDGDLPPVLRTFFESSTQEIVVVFQAHGHWATLTATPDGIGLAWTYFDGLRHHLIDVARHLAWVVGFGLGLTNHSFRATTMIEQTDGFTCGTIALLHVCAFFGFVGTLSPGATIYLHNQLLLRNDKHPVAADELPMDFESDMDLSSATSFLANGSASLVPVGLNNSTMWRALTSVARSPELGSYRNALLVPPFQIADFYKFVLPDLLASGWGHFHLLNGHPLHCFFERKGHWFFLHGLYCPSSKVLLWTVFDGLQHLQSSKLQSDLRQMVDALAGCFHHASSTIDFRCVVPQLHPSTCGTVAILHLGYMVGSSISQQRDEVWALHCDLLASQGEGSFQALGALCESGICFGALGCTFDSRYGLSNHTMWYAMTSLAASEATSSVRAVLLPPFRLVDFTRRILPQFAQDCHDGLVNGIQPILALVEQSGHWLFIVGLVNQARTFIEWTCFDGLDLSQQFSRSNLLSEMVASLSACLAIPGRLVFDRKVSQRHSYVCGTVAILHLACFLGHPLTDNPDDVLAFHDALLTSQYSGDFWALGDNDDQVPAQLAALLTSTKVFLALLLLREFPRSFRS